MEDWEEWNLPWTYQPLVSKSTRLNRDENQPSMPTSPRLSNEEVEGFTRGNQICQAEHSWQELTSLIGNNEVPEAWRQVFKQKVRKFDIGDIDEQLEATESMVEIMMMSLGDPMVVEGSWDDHQNSPLTAEPFSREEERCHMEIDHWITELGVEDEMEGVRNTDWPRKYLTLNTRD